MQNNAAPAAAMQGIPAPAAAASSSSSAAAGVKRSSDTMDAEDQHPQKRVRPQHFHASLYRRTEVELYRDAFHHIYSFLRFTGDEFLTAVQLSKAWYAAAMSLKSRGEKVVGDADAVLNMLRSPLKHHVHHLRLQESASHELMASITQSMPQLTSLTARFGGSQGEEMEATRTASNGDVMPVQYQFPTSLTSLKISVEHHEESTADIELPLMLLGEAVSKITTLQQLTLSFEISGDFVKRSIPMALLCPLRHLPNLTDLRISSLTERDVDAIRAIPSLQQLRRTCFCDLARETFERLVAAPTPKLTRCDFIPLVVSHTLVPSLLRLAPTLETLCAHFEVTDLRTVLPRFVHLTELRIRLHPTNDINFAVQALQQLPQLTSLGLVRIPAEATPQHLADILRPLSNLRVLHIVNASHLISLEFLQSCSSELDVLHLSDCRQLHPIQLHHVRRFQSLTFLQLSRSFCQPLDACTIGQMTPGALNFVSEWWPKLKTFSHVP